MPTFANAALTVVSLFFKSLESETSNLALSVREYFLRNTFSVVAVEEGASFAAEVLRARAFDLTCSTVTALSCEEISLLTCVPLIAIDILSVKWLIMRSHPPHQRLGRHEVSSVQDAHFPPVNAQRAAISIVCSPLPMNSARDLVSGAEHESQQLEVG